MDLFAELLLYTHHCRNIITRVHRNDEFTAGEFSNVQQIHMHFHSYRRAISSDLPRHNINVIDILLRASIKEKHHGWMKYAAFSRGEGFPTQATPGIRPTQCEQTQCGGSTPRGVETE